MQCIHFYNVFLLFLKKKNSISKNTSGKAVSIQEGVTASDSKCYPFL